MVAAHFQESMATSLRQSNQAQYRGSRLASNVSNVLANIFSRLPLVFYGIFTAAHDGWRLSYNLISCYNKLTDISRARGCEKTVMSSLRIW